MNITVYTIAHNEESLIPFFLSHYSQFCNKIVIYDNESTDKTVEIAKKVKNSHVEIIPIETSNQLNDSMYIDVRSKCWVGSDSDYVMLVDVDEFIYHRNIKEYLYSSRKPIYKPVGYNMISKTFPIENVLLTDQIKTGIRDNLYDKPVIFDPKLITRVNYQLGTHGGIFYCSDNNVVDSIYLKQDAELKLLHYKNLSFEYRYERHKYFSTRLSEFNTTSLAGIHYTWEEERQRSEFYNILMSATTVI